MRKLSVIIFVVLLFITTGCEPKTQVSTLSANEAATDTIQVATGTEKAGPEYIYPDPIKTPGAVNPDITQDNIDETICNRGVWSTKSIRPPVRYTNKLKREMLDGGYNYQGDMNMKDYELDHFINLSLGGHPTDPKNLWPESYLTKPGARDKDKVEMYLNREVCNGDMTLKEAQQKMIEDWYKVYLECCQE